MLIRILIFFVTSSAVLRLSCVWPVVTQVEETGVSSENHCLTPSHWQLSHTCPGWNLNPGSGERQLTVTGNSLDHTTIRAGHEGRVGNKKYDSMTTGATMHKLRSVMD